MANVRKITHRPRHDGSVRISWRASWVGADGKRRSKNFPKKGAADDHLKTLGQGMGGSSAMTVKELSEAHYRWFDSLVKEGAREQATLDGYSHHADLIAKDVAFARTKLCDLETPRIQEFLDDALPRLGSMDLVRRLRRSLVTWCKFGQRKGWLRANPAQACAVERRQRPEAGEERLQIPGKNQLGALLSAAAEGPEPERDSAVVRLLMFAGLRISELRGMADESAVLNGQGGALKVREKLERRYNVLGSVKSAKSRRDIPIGPAAARAVKAWRLKRGPAGPFIHKGLRGAVTRAPGRLFPGAAGSPLWDYQDFMRDCWYPLMKRAGMMEMVPDLKGKKRPQVEFGPHTLRHVAASLWIEQSLPPKKVQELLGHATLAMTMDLYGHLWRDDALDAALAKASENLVPAAR